jgi:cleavage and polyadenylation specificity factor subunit 3
VEGKAGSKALRLFRTISLTLDPTNGMVILDWSASPVNDMYADAIVAVLMKSTPTGQDKNTADATVFLEALKDMFGTEEMQFRNESNTFLFNVDGKEIEVDLNKKSIISCDDEVIHSMLRKLLSCPTAEFQ